jgi:hypothetical protein
MDIEPNAPEPDDGDASRISRRDALKKGAIGAGVIGVVWSAPVIEGLAIRPAYGAVASGQQSPHCTADVSSNVQLGCTAKQTGGGVFGSPITGQTPHQPSDATGHQDAVIQSNCGPLKLSIDQFWGDIGSRKRSPTAGKPNTTCNPQNGGGNVTTDSPNGDFCDSAVVTRNDANGAWRIVTTKRVAGNTNCKFADIKYDGILADFSLGVTNPKTGNRGTGASESGDQSQIGFTNDPNFVGDLGRVAQCGGTAHVHIKCT